MRAKSGRGERIGCDIRCDFPYMKEMIMSVRRKLAIAVLAAVLVSPAWAQTTRQTSTTAPATTPQAATFDPDAMTRVIPELKFDGQSLDEVADYLRQVSGLNLVVWRDPDVPAGVPKISCTLHNVTMEQFLEFLGNAYNIGTPTIESNKPDNPNPIVMLKVQMTPQLRASLQSAPPRPFQRVEVFNLKPVVAALSDGSAEGNKKALNDVMSLVQTTLNELSNSEPPSLKIHEPTMSLVFKGSDYARQTLDRSLAALAPAPDEQQKRLKDELGQMRNQLDLERQKLELEGQMLRRQNERLQQELAQLRQQLDANRPATRPNE
jgi:hypothetical protein